jgi:hypothetical protein
VDELVALGVLKGMPVAKTERLPLTWYAARPFSSLIVKLTASDSSFCRIT